MIAEWTGAIDVQAVDLDRDGDLDIVACAYHATEAIKWWENNGQQQWTVRTIANVPEHGVIDISCVDLDRDGDLDVLANSASGSAPGLDAVLWFENNGAQSFTMHTLASGVDCPLWSQAGDLDGDGDLDVVTNAYEADSVFWFENNGSQSFTRHTLESNFSALYNKGPEYGDLVDLDRDGDLDIVVVGEQCPNIVWWENNGAAVFTKHTIPLNASSPLAWSVRAADLDGDGDLDLAIHGYNGLLWYQNDGSQNFDKHVIDITYRSYYASPVFPVDLDKDGDIDLVAGTFGTTTPCCSTTDDDITWWENDGNGNFSRHLIEKIFAGPWNLCAADVDQDGDIDVLGAADYGYEIAWWENLSIAVVTPTPANTPTATATSSLPGTLTRYPYVQLQTTTSILIAWRTSTANDSVIDYGTTPAYGSQVSDPSPTTNHALTLTGLQPDTLYYYRVRSGGTTLAEATCRTARPAANPHFSFAVLGDSGCNCTAQFDVANQLAAINPDLILHVGDVDQLDQGDYDAIFFTPYRTLAQSIPFYPTLGNHDAINEALYLDAFYLPRNNPANSERYYSFDYANAHFVALNALEDYTPGTPQYSWLLNDLASTSQFWKFVYIHYPPYSSGGGGSVLDVRNALSPLFEQYNVDIVFSGHDHHYERTIPIRDYYPNNRGVVYIVSGGGGYPLSPLGELNPWTVIAREEYHALKVTINDHVLTLQALSPYPSLGRLLDATTIDRSQVVTATPTRTATATVTFTATATRTPTATATPTYTPTPRPVVTLLHEDFQSYAAGANPVDWLDQNYRMQTTELYTTRLWDGGMTYGTGTSSSAAYSHYNGAGALEWASYELTGRMLFASSADGVGITVYSQWPNVQDKWYIVMRYPRESYFRLAAHGTSISGGTTTISASPQANTWYQVRILIKTESNRTTIQAKVWQEGTAEPANWQIDAWDTHSTRLTAGTVGVWALGWGGVKVVDDLHVETR